MEFLIIGIVSALNLIIIVHKFKKKRIEDGIFDTGLFITLATLFSGSYAGMVVAMVSSLIVSIYLWSSPPKFFRSFVNSKEVQKVVTDIKEAKVNPSAKKPKTAKAIYEDLNFD